MMQRFGEKLKLLRKQRQLTLHELAAALGHADHTYLSKVENGKKRPSIELVITIAKMFNITTDQLLLDNLEVFPLENSS